MKIEAQAHAKTKTGNFLFDDFALFAFRMWAFGHGKMAAATNFLLSNVKCCHVTDVRYQLCLM